MDNAGLLGLISGKNDLSTIFSKESTTGQLGFAVINDYFSETLFPGISTLMPNLVYCYLIFALTWNKEQPNDTSRKDMLYEITKGERFSRANKGFHGKVKEDIVSTYRRFMIRYGFYETDLTTAFGKLNNKYAQHTSNSKEKARYREIQKLIEGKQADVSPFLYDYEKTDMVQRCLVASGIKYQMDKQKIMLNEDRAANSGFFQLSLFDLAVLKLACKPNKSNYNELSVRQNGNIPVLENMGTLFDGQIIGKESELYQRYEAARFASLMQFYIKCRSNQLIRAEKRAMRGEEPIKQENLVEKLKIGTKQFSWEEDAHNKMIEAMGNIDGCKNKINLLWEIYKMVSDDTQDGSQAADELIWKIIRDSDTETVAEWNRGESTEYLDTFRWEYRPEDERHKKKTEVQSDEMIFDREAGNTSKCASYFVMELLK